eukprot:PITA_30819
MGIACGLLYLHEGSQLRIIDRDIKKNNIVLDERLNPKIADFGLARLFPEDETHIQTRVAGTYGTFLQSYNTNTPTYWKIFGVSSSYLVPEYAMQGKLSVKVDVYNFGVLALKIASGRKNSDINFAREMQNLLEWAWRLYKKGLFLDMINSIVEETCSQEEAVICIHVALLCIQADAGICTTISNVILMISSSSVMLPNPTQPAFVKSSESNLGGSTDTSRYGSGKHEPRSSATTSSVSSASLVIDDATITEIKAREVSFKV